MPVCGPRPGADAAPGIVWGRAGVAAPRVGCGELAFRFMALAYGVAAYAATPEDRRPQLPRHRAPAGRERHGGAAPAPGDVISFDSATTTGHVAVVAWSSVGANGNGSVVVLSQNDTANGWRTLAVTGWVVSGFADDVPYAWLHDPAGRGPPQLPAGATVEGRAELEPPPPNGARPPVPDPPAGGDRPPVVHVG